MLSKVKTQRLILAMHEVFPDAHCELNYKNHFELLIAVLLSARTTDKSVNKLTKTLFVKYPTPESFLSVPLEDLIHDMSSIGLYRSKAKHVQECCRQLLECHNGQVPQTFEELTKLSGVGRKTANVVLSVGFDYPAIAVDTHVEKVSKCLGIVPENATVLEVEETLMKKIPREQWSKTHHVMIFWGRYRCLRHAKLKHCSVCQQLKEDYL